MTREEEELEQELDLQRAMFAGIALPGLITLHGTILSKRALAHEAFQIGDAMLQESKLWTKLNTEEEDESNS